MSNRAYSLIVIFLILSINLFGQSSAVRIIYAKVINVEGQTILDGDFAFKMRIGVRRYYYAIKHFEVVDSKGDTMFLAYVFDTKRQLAEAANDFGIKKDSVYEFSLSRFKPCKSDFPNMIGCAYEDTLYMPHPKSIIKKSYDSIDRIHDAVHIFYDLWLELIR
ncbi:hypothetical protein [Chitinophaga silvisoli]|nr:hypothetical protein [Chitinophaga silvisoli]